MLMKLARAFSSLPYKYNPKPDIIRLLKKDPARTPSGSSGSLFSRILEASNPKVSIFNVLDQWVNEGRSVELQELRNIIKLLTKLTHHHHALQISQWMGSKSYLHLSSTDFNLQLDLISKVHGVQQAEDYFNNIPITSKDFWTYETLLNSYADAKLLEKAEGVMQIIRDLSGYKTISYNVMLKLYSNLGKCAKLDSLLQEMEEIGIEMNIYTYSTILNAYANASDIGRMQKLLMKMETDFLVTMDWSAYVIAAKGYLRAGDMGKAVASLKTFEHLIPVAARKSAFSFLMTMYANMGKKDEVYRIWNLYKKDNIICNTSYLCMMSSLVKLDNLDGAQKVYDEWEAENISFDIRLPNFLISAYCRKGLLAKAESMLQSLSEDGKEPNASTWARMAFGYRNEKQMEKAVEAVQKSLLASGPGSEPNFSVLNSCLKYLNKKGDLERIEHVKRLLEKQGTKCAYAIQRPVKMSKEEINPDLRAVNPIESDELALEEEMIQATGTRGGDYNNKSAPTRVSVTDSARTLATIPATILLSRLLRASKRKAKFTTILDQWVEEGRSIEIEELREIIKKFRKLRLIKMALQISQWMSGKSLLDLSSADFAVQLDLVSEVHGVKQAEHFFNKIPNSLKNFQIYGALLKCYADARLLGEAEVVMQMMRNLRYATTLSYNMMLKLYSNFRMYDKLDYLVQEMEKNKIELDIFTYNVLLDAYVGALDIDRMEKLLMKMESDSLATMDWNAYVLVAKGYLRAGNMVKALASLKKSEQLVTFTSQNLASDILMIMYNLMGEKDEADRICNLYKSNQKILSRSYLHVMKSLANLGDIDYAQKVFDEWETKTSTFSSHPPNFLISAYCKNGRLGKAESILQKFLQHGAVPSARAWTAMAYGYQKEKKMDKAVEALKNSILACKRGYKPSFTILDSCLKHLIDMGDLDGIEHIKRLLAERGIGYTNVFKRLRKSDKETCHSSSSYTNALKRLKKSEKETCLKSSSN